MNEETAEGAAASVYYFLDLYRYAFMTGDTTEFANMSEDRCKFCQSTINDADAAHKKGGWANKWDQEIVDLTYYEKLEGYDYNRVKVVINFGATISCPEAGAEPQCHFFDSLCAPAWRKGCFAFLANAGAAPLHPPWRKKLRSMA